MFDFSVSVRLLIILFLFQIHTNLFGVRSDVMNDFYEKWFNHNEEINITQVAQECNKTFPINASDAQYFADYGQLPNENNIYHKCFYRCLYENGGLISLESGHYNIDLVAKYFSAIRENVTMSQNVVAEMARRCYTKTDHADMCEKIYLYSKCIVQEELKFYGAGIDVENDD